MPFAINEATRFISPTKTLEYMACGRPLGQHPDQDVVEPDRARGRHRLQRGRIYSGLLKTHPAAHAGPASGPRPAVGGQLVSRTSWDATAEAMVKLIEQTEHDRVAGVRSQPAEARQTCAAHRFSSWMRSRRFRLLQRRRRFNAFSAA